jgi:hypothetical protein
MYANDFSVTEAARWRGATVETARDYICIPKGTRGKVIDTGFLSPFGLMIEWDMEMGGKPFLLPFTAGQVQAYLRRIDPVPDELPFDADEASALVGRVFETAVNFSLLRKGARGKIVGTARRGEGTVIIVEWIVPGREQPLRSWYTKNQVLRFGRIVAG